ncbi:MAG: type IV pilin protein [Pseudomonadota bacterium]
MCENTLAAARRNTSGFTLMELLIAMAVAAILASIAFPSFADAMRRARRAEAISTLLQLQLAQERWRSDHSRYSSQLGELGVPQASSSGLYRVAITEADEAGYTLTATAASLQAGDGPCRVLKLVQRGGRTTRSSVDATGTETTTLHNRCWQ